MVWAEPGTRGVVWAEGGCQQSWGHDLLHPPTAPKQAHRNTIANHLFRSIDQPDGLISLITWCTWLTPSYHFRGDINVCTELLHLHGYIYSHALMFDEEEAYKNQPQRRRWIHSGRETRDDGLHDLVKKDFANFFLLEWQKKKTLLPWSASAATSPAVSSVEQS